MAGYQDFIEFYDDFLGDRSLLETNTENNPWNMAVTGAGPPTFTIGGINGLATLAHSTDVQVQNVCMDFGDDLNFDIDLLQYVEFGVVLGQAALDATTMYAMGLASARNDAIDSLAEQALFRGIGADSTTNLVVETDDGTNNNDDVATGTTFLNVQKKFRISFTHGTADVRFYVDDSRVAAGTTFDMSNYTGGLQPYFQIQKTSDSNADSLIVDYIHIVSRRA